MSLMANPMDALLSYQHALNAGTIYTHEMDGCYLKRYGEVKSGKRYDYVKIVYGEVQALAIFGEEEPPFNGVNRYSVGYAVSETRRGRGLAVEAVNKGIEELKKEFGRVGMKSFYLEAVVGETNSHSIKVAKELFPGSAGKATTDSESGTPSLLFYKLIGIS